MPGEEDPVARAEKALAELSSEFGSWMESECARLDAARNAISKTGFSKTNKEALFHAAHDIKGEVATFGFPAVALGRRQPVPADRIHAGTSRIPMKLVDQHVDAVRAIYREYPVPTPRSSPPC